jgi:anti-anti-sigma factor
MTNPDPFRPDGAQRHAFEVRPRTEGTALVLHVSGEVDLSTAGELEEAVAAALVDQPTALVVDLTDVAFLDSAGLGVLAHGHLKATEQLSLRIVVTSEVVLKPLRLTGLDKLLAIYDSVDAALRA